MIESLASMLLRLSEAGEPAVLWGRQAASYSGPDFERLLRHGVLIEQAPATEWDVCPTCDCGVDARPIMQIDGRSIAVCPIDHRADLALDAEDLRSFRIEPAALVREIAFASGVSDEPVRLAPGVWRLGLTPSKHTAFLALSRCAVLQDGLLPVLRGSTQSASISMLTPTLSTADIVRLTDAGLHLVATSAALVANATGIGAAIDWTKLEPTPQSPRLRVDFSSGRVHAYGRSVTLSHQLAPVFRRLVEKVRSNNPIASGPEIEGTSGREAKDLIREMRDALKAEGMSDHEAKALIANVRGRGWRIGVEASEIVVEG